MARETMTEKPFEEWLWDVKREQFFHHSLIDKKTGRRIVHPKPEDKNKESETKTE